jgi:hypothetical protein
LQERQLRTCRHGKGSESGRDRGSERIPQIGLPEPAEAGSGLRLSECGDPAQIFSVGPGNEPDMKYNSLRFQQG